MRRLSPLVSIVAVIAGLLAGGVFVAAAAQDTDPADHPIVGSWLAFTPGGPALSVFHPDGTVMIANAGTQAGPAGVGFNSIGMGSWEPVSERGIHFTTVRLNSDAEGNLTGSVQTDGYPVVSEDGLVHTDTSPETTITIRDATGAVVDVIAGASNVTATRIGVGSPPEFVAPAAASPAP